jgi:arabinan endo-1,5-alpha-L-arabinosidase
MMNNTASTIRSKPDSAQRVRALHLIHPALEETMLRCFGKNILLGAVVFASSSLLPVSRAQEPKALELTGDYAGTHDPSIGREGDKYYVFATGLAPGGGQFAIRCSDNLTDWKLCGHVFDDIPGWIHETSPGTKELWAPDISYFNGKYHLYYAYSLFGVNTSGIALATNETLDPTSPKYRWSDEGLVLRSTAADDFNAIDPNIVLDKSGQPWLSLGSFWSGIKMRKIDAATGKLSGQDTRTYALASRKPPEHPEPARPGLPADWQAIEAPFVICHQGYYYLFVSFDLCCRGLKSSYRTMVGRSKQVTGPYVDRDGVALLDGGGTALLVANNRWLGPGGESVLQRPEGDLIVFHAYDAATGKPALQISTLAWKDGWPHAALGTTGQAK